MIAVVNIRRLALFNPANVSPVGVTQVGENGVVTSWRTKQMVLRIVTSRAVGRGVIVSVIVVARPWSEKEMICQQRDRYSQQRLESIPWSAIYGLHIADRRKHHPTAVRGIVPITSHKNPTAGRPDIPRWNPDPVWAARLPVARRPEITFRLPLPMTWHPERVISRLRAAGAALQGGWGLRQIGLLSGLRRCPVTGHPLVLTAEIIPVSRNPLPIRRNSAPDAADPDKVVRLIVPCPVSRDPKDIISLGTLIRRQFLNGWGRFFWYN